MNEILSQLKTKINRRMEDLGGDFLADENLPSFNFEGINIINPFYSENMIEEVNPIKYYNMTMDDIEKFINYYL